MRTSDRPARAARSGLERIDFSRGCAETASSCGAGRASQAEGRAFEPRRPLPTTRLLSDSDGRGCVRRWRGRRPVGGGFGLGAHLPACVGRSAQGSGSRNDPGRPDDTVPTPRAPGRRRRPPGVAAGLPQLPYHSPVARGVRDSDLASSFPCQDEARHRQACFGASPRVGSRLLDRRGRVSRRHDRSPISDSTSGNAEYYTRVPCGRAGAEAEMSCSSCASRV